MPRFPGLDRQASTASQSLTPQAISSLGNWSKLVFQSLRNDNWEIYVFGGDNPAPTRLTSNDKTDSYPRLNRGGTRIAFATNRNGNYEIYAMNSDGTGAQRLTSTSANEYSPFWSPNGAKIAFTSYRALVV